MMKKVALTIAIALSLGLTTLAVPNQYEDSSGDGDKMILTVGIIALVALVFYGLGYYVGKNKDKDDY